ncbi:hypothetical protein Patl1_27000 [Pistacia atlantica]|uniref:Uncharacterized protein n=1 Tax=Pistacia atlantica TaxID=434234 RepID=A0ACC1B0B9_9ROSI|nr:hypothetical protein Patl1_27000 [Pistacia atlantica]
MVVVLRLTTGKFSGGSDVYDSPRPSQTLTDNTSFFSVAGGLTRAVNNVHEVNDTRSYTRVLSFIFDFVGSLFYGMKMTNFHNETPHGDSAQVDDWQTLSGGSDVHDSLSPSQTLIVFILLHGKEPNSWGKHCQ